MKPAAVLAIRQTGPGDAAAVEHVLRASYSVLLAGDYPAALIARVLPAMTRANPRLLASGSYYLAEMTGEPVGCGGWTPDGPAGDRAIAGIGHLRHFAVDPGWVRCGIGRSLFDCCERDALAAAIDRFECHSTLTAEPFYAALGFTRIGRLRIAIAGAVVPAVHMARRIAAPRGQE